MKRTVGLVGASLLLAACGSSTATDDPSAVASGPKPGAVVGSLSAAQIRAAAPSPEIAQAAGVSPASAKAAIEVAAGWSWKLIQAANVTQAMACTGSGSPTVVYFNGLIVQSSWTWPLVAQKQSATNRVCVFDRPGTGLSPQRPEMAAPNGPVANADEALALLDAAGEKGPYTFVGWSYGGLVARVAASKAADQLTGLVLVDAVSPTQYKTFDTQGWNEAGTPLDMKAADTLIGEGPDLGSKPLVVLEAGADLGGDAGPNGAKVWHAEQVKAAKLSTNSALGVVTKAQHQIPQQNPDAVVAATTATNNDGKPAEACTTTFPKVGIVCDKG